MIDLHSHLLPGLDDGPARPGRRRSRSRARRVPHGVTAMAATPHLRADFPASVAGSPTGRRARAAVGAGRGGRGAAGRLRRRGRRVVGAGRERRGPAPRRRYGGPRHRPAGRDALRRAARRSSRTCCSRSACAASASCSPTRSATRPSSATRRACCGSSTGDVLVQVTAASLAAGGGRARRSPSDRLIADGHAHVIAADLHRRRQRPRHAARSGRTRVAPDARAGEVDGHRRPGRRSSPATRSHAPRRTAVTSTPAPGR